eukprot:TRINITY_DN17933_c0_g1_i3.p1 TRINITY_DN17933_c0_g1~~TRINITY_DN17933_c0_g1_i3.p1  ORF type:complete len:261 (-),score=6.78 TRINITY_DN17933_c0_g1_i3:39-785(-)
MTYSTDICIKQCIRSQYAWTSKMSLWLVLQQHSFVDVLNNILQMYCIRCGDFVDIFLSDINEQSLLSSQISFLALQSSFEDALHLSSLSKNPLVTSFKLVGKEVEIDEFQEGKCIPNNIKIECEVGWPLSSVITDQIINKLNELFRQLLVWKIISLRLSTAWHCQKENRSLFTRYLLNIHRFSNSILIYLENDLLAQWQSFVRKVKNDVRDVIELKLQLTDFVDLLLKQSRYPGCAECDMQIQFFFLF